MSLNCNNQTMFIGDNVEVLRGLNSASVDLVYMDPPFNSNSDWAALPGTDDIAAESEFKDRWDASDLDGDALALLADRHPSAADLVLSSKAIHSSGMQAYLCFLATRFVELKRVLKRQGSIYVHCDVSAGHYIKLMMDAIYGRRAYQRHITWRRHSAHNYTMFGNISDFILYYGAAPGVNVTRNKKAVRVPLTDDNIEYGYRHEDDRGRYKHEHITLTNKTGRMGGDHVKPWHGYDPGADDKYWCTPYTGDYAHHLDAKVIPGFLKIENVIDRLDAMHDADLIHWSKNDKPMMKRYLVEDQGMDPSNLWSDIHGLSSSANERTGYPTQKPVQLLDRIIKASSNVGDVVLDPFFGSGTTLLSAEKNGRQWIGIDQSKTAADVAVKRIREAYPLFAKPNVTHALPVRDDE